MTTTQTVVVQQGAVYNTQSDWQKGLCGCFEDITVCLISALFPCCAMASARSEFDGSNWCFNCLCLGNAVVFRNILREGYNIKGGCCEDIVCGWCLSSCVVCQGWNEVRARGPVTMTRGDVTGWNNSLFGCLANVNTCIFGWCCPTCAVAQARTDFDGSDCCFNFCFVQPAMIRSIIREGYNIEGSCFLDIIIPCLCSQCNACQLLNEVHSRGRVGNTAAVVTTTTHQPMPQKMA